jgi:tRNA (guanine9-N1)-methyltransferase
METKPDLGHSPIPDGSSEDLKETTIATEAVTSKFHEASQSTNGDIITETVSALESAIELEPKQEAPPPETADSSRSKATPSIVYLTADSPHTLEYLSPNTCYIIGGIVDKNRHKGLCYKRACERGIPTAKLPIGEYMTMQSRSVLAVNHVVEIMLKWLVTGDWGEAFLSVIPKRKEAKLKVKKGAENQSENQGEEEEEGEESEDEEGGASILENNAIEAVDAKEPDERRGWGLAGSDANDTIR